MPDLLPITVAEQIAELKREAAMRRQVYPRQVAARAMSQERADRQLALLEAAIATLEALEARRPYETFEDAERRRQAKR